MLYYKSTTLFACGKRGIRTLGTRKGTTVFETVPIDHSGIFPWGSVKNCARADRRVPLGRIYGCKVTKLFDISSIPEAFF